MLLKDFFLPDKLKTAQAAFVKHYKKTPLPRKSKQSDLADLYFSRRCATMDEKTIIKA
jgi:hypothetical protein